MKGLIIYNSLTGSNSKLAELLYEALHSLNLDFKVSKLLTKRKLPLPLLAFYSLFGVGQKLSLKIDLTDFEAVILLGPVYANGIAPALRQLISESSSLKNIKFFIMPCCFTPAKNAISQISKQIQRKGGSVVGSIAVNAKQLKDSTKTSELICTLSDAITRSFNANY